MHRFLILSLSLCLLGCPTPPAPGDDDDSTPDIPLPLTGTSLLQAPVQISGIPDEQSLLGHSMATCDFDGDGKEDLVVASPEAAGGRGLVSVFFGANSGGWDSTTSITDADIAFDGTVGSRVGYGVACDDFDGDGRTDIAAGKARWFSPQGDELYAVGIWHASDEPWQDVHGIDEAATVTSQLNFPTEGFGGQSWMELNSGDLDGDGAAEIILIDRQANPPDSPVTDALYVLPGQYWEGSQDLEDSFRARLTGFSPGSLQGGALLVADLNNEPGLELLVGEPFSGSVNNHLGRVSILENPQGEGAIFDLASAVIEEGGEARAFGEAAAAGDFNGDGLVDLAVSGVEENIEGPEPHGSVWVYLNIGNYQGNSNVNEGDGHVAGDPTAGYLGMDLQAVAHGDDDGSVDLLVYQADLLDVPGTLWLLSGAKLSGTLYPEEAEITRWRSPNRGSVMDRVIVGDFDADGVEDYTVGTPQFEDRDDVSMLDIGRLSIWLSSGQKLPPPEATSWIAASFWLRIAGQNGPQAAEITVESPSETTTVTASEIVVQVDRDTDWLLRFTSDDIYPTQFYGRSGPFDSSQMLTLWSEAYWSDALTSIGKTPDPQKGHVLVGLAKRDGAGVVGRNADLSADYEARAIFANEGLATDLPLQPGPADRSFVYFVNVSPGTMDVLFELENGESCYPAPGGVDSSENRAIEVAAGEFTIVNYHCNLNRL